MLNERQKVIFEALVREYVANATPVSSGELVKKYRMPYSPATVRNELLALDREGLIYQPHTSAGRIPTDQGYRFFIEHGTEGRKHSEKKNDRKLQRSFDDLKGIHDAFDFLRETSRLLAHFSGEMSIAGFAGRNILYKSGMSEVLQRPEFSDDAMVRDFSELIDFLDDELQDYFEEEDVLEPRVFIGEENPIPEARNYAMIVARAETPFKEKGIFAIIGPRRMDYEQNVFLLRAFGDLFHKESY